MGWSAGHGFSLLLSISTFTFLYSIIAPIVLIKQWCLLKKKWDDQRDTAFHFAATLSFRLALPQRRANTYTTKGVIIFSIWKSSKFELNIQSLFFYANRRKHLSNSCRLLPTAAVGYWTCKQDLEVVCTPILATKCFLKQDMSLRFFNRIQMMSLMFLQK